MKGRVPLSQKQSEIDNGRFVEFYPNDNMYRVFFPYDKELVVTMRAFGSYRDTPEYGKRWEVAYTGRGNEFVERLRDKHEFQIHDEATFAISGYDSRLELNKAQARAIEGPWQIDIGGRFPIIMEPRRYQEIAMDYAIRNRRCVFGDTMGLGKTAEFILTVNKLDRWPVLLVCGSRLKQNLKTEFEKWLDGVSVYICSSLTDPVPEGYDVYIANFEILGRRMSPDSVPYDVPVFFADRRKKRSSVIAATGTGKRLYEMDFQVIGVDEVQRIKNRGSIRARSLHALGRRAPYKFALSGGAIENSPAEFVGTLTWLDWLDAMGGWEHFIKHYCAGHKKIIYIKGGGGSTRTVWVTNGWDQHISDSVENAVMSGTDLDTATRDAIEFRNRRLVEMNEDMRRKGIYIRRTLQEVVPQLGDPVPNEVFVELDNWDEYEAEEDAFLFWLNDYDSSADAYDDDPAHALALYGKLWRLSSVGKVEAIAAMLQDNFVGQEKVIVWEYHVDAQEALAEAVPEALRLQGAESVEFIKQIFQEEEDDAHVLLASMAADREGHTLTAAWYQIFGTLYWNPAWIDQAIARSYGRQNDMHIVYVTYVLGVDSIDLDMMNLVESKRRVVAVARDGVMPDTLEVSTEMSQRAAYIGLMDRMKQRRR